MTVAPRRRLRRSKAFAQRLVTHPRWIVENVRLARARWESRSQPFPVELYASFLVGQEEAVTRSLNVSKSEFDQAICEVAVETIARHQLDAAPAAWNGSNEFISTLGAVVRLTKPSIIVETGVARGYSSAIMLASLHANQFGHLHSVDFPALEVAAHTFVGSAIPESLRDRWTLHIGPSRHILPKLLLDLHPIDMFVHDADHTFDSQLEEYRTAWPHIRPGGVLLSDDVGNPAFIEFSTEIGQQPLLVSQAGKPSPFGIIHKPE